MDKVKKDQKEKMDKLARKYQLKTRREKIEDAIKTVIGSYNSGLQKKEIEQFQKAATRVIENEVEHGKLEEYEKEYFINCINRFVEFVKQNNLSSCSGRKILKKYGNTIFEGIELVKPKQGEVGNLKPNVDLHNGEEQDF